MTKLPMRRLMRINLEDRYKIVDTGDPELALEAALQSKPNVILLDLRMPNYSGFELCRTFKSITSTQLIPIIIVTGEAGATTKSYCEELGAAAYFEKPIDFKRCGTDWKKCWTPLTPKDGVRCALPCGSWSICEGPIARQNLSKSCAARTT